MANQDIKIVVASNPVFKVYNTSNPLFKVYVNNGAKGEQGIQGIQGFNGSDGKDGVNGINGVGVASGGFVGQYLHKKSETDYDTEFKTIDSTEVAYGDGNVSEALQGLSEQIALKTTITISSTEPSNPSINDLWLEI